MGSKFFRLPYSGLKNVIILNNSPELIFTFNIGGKSLEVNRLIADFLSPKISKFHFVDPSINSFTFEIKKWSYHDSSMNRSQIKETTLIYENQIYHIMQQLILGDEIEIHKEDFDYYYFIAYSLENEELLKYLDEIYSFDFKIDNWIPFLHQHLMKSKFLSSNLLINSEFIDFLSEHFYEICSDLLREVEHQNISFEMIKYILSNDNLVILNEDQLLDFIISLTDFNHIKDRNHQNFYEFVEFEKLSENGIERFFSYFDYNELTNELWSKLKIFFHPNHSNLNVLITPRYPDNIILNKTFDLNQNINRFTGVIHYLTKECGGNVHDKNVVAVSSSSFHGLYSIAKNVVDLENKTNYYQSKNEKNSWICYDFKDKRIQPTYYSIRSRHDSNSHHLQTWSIEGFSEVISDWVELDYQTNVNCLKGINSEHTFEITKHKNKTFQKLRLFMKGENTNNCYFLTISALEFYGKLIQGKSQVSNHAYHINH
ncbi:hypothetical protein TRFO_02828 [Tritrichomonas foetus]|uniref:F5/8 type C domain-containing protein n=1 Tax=Tritrichomonas foetus TaxID=1144522 RepID=A0A1J4L0N6_9EUKA|nr:hypothetical protein TRFO_02828 [Tritrichomonas foetus]|eukprot:OHT15508.1 hypothetical protein TRFO_02828 [Tritrichomonas foetus]